MSSSSQDLNCKIIVCKLLLTAIAFNLKILKKLQLKGFYKGMLFPLLCSGTLNSAFFGFYAICLGSLQSSRGHSPNYVLPTNSGYYYDNFIAGCVGGVAQALISCPSELIKIRMQIGKGIQYPPTYLLLNMKIKC